MPTSDNKAICRRHYQEVLTNKQVGVVDQIYADHIAYGDSQSMPREQFKLMAKASTEAFPDLKVTVHAQVAEGDIVVTRWSAAGTHLGDFMGHKPTGKSVQINAIHMHQIANGRICHLWEQIDLLGLSRQLGITIP